MQEVRIQFRSVNDIHNFVRLAEKYETDIDLRLGSQVVDAKSLLGVLYFGINKDLKVCVPEKIAIPFFKEISFCISD